MLIISIVLGLTLLAKPYFDFPKKCNIEANICLKLRPDSASGTADSFKQGRCYETTRKRPVQECQQKQGTNVMNCQVLMNVRKAEFSLVIKDASN
jgi:hypothetical protein